MQTQERQTVHARASRGSVFDAGKKRRTIWASRPRQTERFRTTGASASRSKKNDATTKYVPDEVGRRTHGVHDT